MGWDHFDPGSDPGSKDLMIEPSVLTGGFFFAKFDTLPQKAIPWDST